MSQKEAPRPGLVKAALAGKITSLEGAVALGLSARQFRRLKAKFRTAGVSGLLHGLRGQPSPRRLDAEHREGLRELACGKYADFNDTHATEKIREVEGLLVGRETVRKLRREHGLAPKRRHRPPQHRQRRARFPRRGSLVQIDGSDHRWFGDGRPRCCLMGGIDDATSEVLVLLFRPTEDLHGYLELLERMACTHGLPAQLYGDRAGTLVRNDSHWTLEEELRGEQDPTMFGQAIAELGVGFIAAQSAQGKGRIERLWNTLQDRLIAELALAGITDVAEANGFLPEFIADHNRRFAIAPDQSMSSFRKPPKRLDLILSCRYSRRVAKDNTVSLPGRWIQLPPGPGGRSWAGQRVDARELLDGRLIVLHDGRTIASQDGTITPFTLAPRACKARRKALGNDGPRPPAPSHQPPTSRVTERHFAPNRPAQNHPWKRRAVLPAAPTHP